MTTMQTVPELGYERSLSLLQSESDAIGSSAVTICDDSTVAESQPHARQLRLDLEHQLPPGGVLAGKLQLSTNLQPAVPAEFVEGLINALALTGVCQPPASAPDSATDEAPAAPQETKKRAKRRSAKSRRIRREQIEASPEMAQTERLPDFLKQRVQEILIREVEFIDNPIFAAGDEAIIAEIMALTPRSDEERGSSDAPPPFLEEAFDATLLSQPQESQLFRKMNFCRRQMWLCREKIEALLREQDQGYTSRNARRCRRLKRLCNMFERMEAVAVEIVHALATANLGLVGTYAKQFKRKYGSRDEPTGIGNLALMRAIGKFDFSRGNKFSTYASWAIFRSLTGNSDEWDWRAHAQQCDGMGWVPDHHESETHEPERKAVALQTLVHDLLPLVRPRDREVLQATFGVGRSRIGLKSLHLDMGVSKERVLQIRRRGLKKLRRLCEKAGITPDLVFG